METLWHSFHGTPSVLQGTPWHSMELYDIPWNFMDLHQYFMEFRGTPWHSVELHGIPWNPMDTPWILHGSSMEFHGFRR